VRTEAERAGQFASNSVAAQIHWLIYLPQPDPFRPRGGLVLERIGLLRPFSRMLFAKDCPDEMGVLWESPRVVFDGQGFTLLAAILVAPAPAVHARARSIWVPPYCPSNLRSVAVAQLPIRDLRLSPGGNRVARQLRYLLDALGGIWPTDAGGGVPAGGPAGVTGRLSGPGQGKINSAAGR